MILPERLLHVFHWPATYQIRLVLPLMLVVSLLLHAIGLYFMRAQPVSARAALPPLPMKLGLWADAASSVLLQTRDPAWIEPGRLNEWPGSVLVISPPSRALHPALPELVPAPERVVEKKWVPALPPVAEHPVLIEKLPPPLPEWQGLAARFDGGGPEVTTEVMGRLQAVAPQILPAGATELMVSLDAAGQVRHVWLLRGSGDTALDAAAMRAVQRSRFGSRAEGFEGILRIVWAPGGASSM